jgi:tripartite-type tricarboxylate transporter receptor subunit TctC
MTSKARTGAAPDIPTTAEAGLPGFQASLWYGLWAPKGTPKDVVANLNATMIDALNDAAVKKRFAELALDMPSRDQQAPEALRTLQKAEADKWWPIIKAANIKPQ